MPVEDIHLLVKGFAECITSLKRKLFEMLNFPFFLLFSFFQEDVVMGTLTVRENLHFSASLRLPSKLRKWERNDRVEKTISDLGLFHVAESKVC